MKQCNFQNNYGTVAQKKVSSCAPIFKFLYGPLDFFLGQIYTKNAIFKGTKVKVSAIVGTWETLPMLNFCKNCLSGYTPLGQIYTKNYQFQRFLGVVSPLFKSDNGEIRLEGTDLGYRPRA